MKMIVKPTVPGNIVRDPLTMRPIPAAGTEVPMTTFWRRRLAAGDVVRVVAEEQPKQAKGKQSKTTTKEGDA